MPQILNGNILGGIADAGGVQLLVPGSPQVTLVGPNSGNVGWFDERTALYQNAQNQFWRIGINGQQNQIMDGSGVSLCRGRGGVYAAFLANGSGVRGTYAVPTAKGLLGVTPDLYVVTISPDYSSIIFSNSEGSQPVAGAWPIVFYPYPQFSAIDRNRYVWLNAHVGWESVGLPTPNAYSHPYDAFVVQDVDGQYWFGYHTDEGPAPSQKRLLVQKLTDPTQGYIVATGETFGTDGEIVAPNVLRVGWGNADENVLAYADVDLTAPMVPFKTPSVMPTFDNPIWTGTFFPTR